MPRSKTTPAVSQNEADHPTSPVQHFAAHESLLLDSGASLGPWQIAYQTYGTLNTDKSNAILICHALTGDQHVASDNPVTGKPGWWTRVERASMSPTATRVRPLRGSLLSR